MSYVKPNRPFLFFRWRQTLHQPVTSMPAQSRLIVLFCANARNFLKTGHCILKHGYLQVRRLTSHTLSIARSSLQTGAPTLSTPARSEVPGAVS
jgi:hypothetical protein